MTLPTHLFLEQLGIPFESREFPIATEKGAASVAHVLGFEERQAVKTLIFQLGAGEAVLVMLGGDQTAVSGNLKRVVGSRDVRMASPKVVKDITDYTVGSIPPFGWQPEGFRSFIEVSLLDEPILGVGAGQWGHEIMIRPADLLRASHAKAVKLISSLPPESERRR